MKVTISKDRLLSGLQAVQNVVSSRTTLPVLSNILLNASEGKLSLTATDLDVTVSCTVPAQVITPGTVTLPAKRFFEITREVPASEIELDSDDKAICSIQAGSAFFRIHGLPGEDFPQTPTFSQSRAVTVQQDKLRSMLKKTGFAVSTDESRYTLNGIFFSLKEHKMILVSTDGRRLALVEEECDVPAECQADFIVPSKAINELTRLLTMGTVEIKFSENQAAFTATPATEEGGLASVLITKLVDGNFPNYRQVIPQQCLERVPVAREELLKALRLAEIMTTDKSNSVKLAFTRNQLAITANAPEVGETRQTIAINYKGKDVAIAFNPGFLMDPLKALDNDQVYLELTDELSPGVVKVDDPFLYVIMPMRLS